MHQRFTMTTRWLVLSPEDCNRFNLRIVRGRIDEDMPLPGALWTDITDLAADIAIIRLPAGNTEPLSDLIERGLTPIHADTLVYHSRDISAPVLPHDTNSALSVELATPADKPRLETIARQAFSSYRSHYHANKCFDRAKVTEGYAEWAASFVSKPSTAHETWIVRDSGTAIAFATCALDKKGSSVEIVLNAVARPHSGRGVYGYLLNEILLAYKLRGFTLVCISTQIWNYTVQRVWTRAGFLITHAYDTYHINIHPGADPCR
jgi:GNAT superfamily N-acetyltransferase